MFRGEMSETVVKIKSAKALIMEKTICKSYPTRIKSES